jgi:hypothetical protein
MYSFEQFVWYWKFNNLFTVNNFSFPVTIFKIQNVEQGPETTLGFDPTSHFQEFFFVLFCFVEKLITICSLLCDTNRTRNDYMLYNYATEINLLDKKQYFLKFSPD